MNTDIILLAVLMFAVTYPSRAIGLLTPGFERLPAIATEYLQLVGPAILAALAAVAVMVNLLLGLVAAVGIVAIARAVGLDTLAI